MALVKSRIALVKAPFRRRLIPRLAWASADWCLSSPRAFSRRAGTSLRSKAQAEPILFATAPATLLNIGSDCRPRALGVAAGGALTSPPADWLPADWLPADWLPADCSYFCFCAVARLWLRRNWRAVGLRRMASLKSRMAAS